MLIPARARTTVVVLAGACGLGVVLGVVLPGALLADGWAGRPVRPPDPRRGADLFG